jgi:hypothetical protein
MCAVKMAVAIDDGGISMLGPRHIFTFVSLALQLTIITYALLCILRKMAGRF